MVTVIDNLNLDEESRKWFKNILNLFPIKIKVSSWIDLEDIIKKIEKNLGEDEIRILVATGGVEAYVPKKDEKNVFVFKSPNFGKTNEATFKINFKDYQRIIDNPSEYHKKELNRLQDYLSNFNKEPIKIIEGDVGNTGLSIARLCAIYQAVYEKHVTEILIGSAPANNIFKVKRKTSLVLPSGNNFYDEDIRNILELEEVPYKVIFPSKDPYIRRVSEIIGVSKKEELEKDVEIVADYWQRQGLRGEKLKNNIKWYRNLTLKKIGRNNFISERIEQIENSNS